MKKIPGSLSAVRLMQVRNTDYDKRYVFLLLQGIASVRGGGAEGDGLLGRLDAEGGLPGGQELRHQPLHPQG